MSQLNPLPDLSERAIVPAVAQALFEMDNSMRRAHSALLRIQTDAHAVGVAMDKARMGVEHREVPHVQATEEMAESMVASVVRRHNELVRLLDRIPVSA